MTDLKVNGKPHHLEADPETPLLWILRDHLGLTGTKYSCGIGECGACTVQMDGEPVASCSVTLPRPRQKRNHYRRPGQPGGQGLAKGLAKGKRGPSAAIASRARSSPPPRLLEKAPRPGEREIKDAMSGVLCRCGTYQAIVRAVKMAAKEVGHG